MAEAYEGAFKMKPGPAGELSHLRESREEAGGVPPPPGQLRKPNGGLAQNAPLSHVGMPRAPRDEVYTGGDEGRPDSAGVRPTRLHAARPMHGMCSQPPTCCSLAAHVPTRPRARGSACPDGTPTPGSASVARGVPLRPRHGCQVAGLLRSHPHPAEQVPNRPLLVAVDLHGPQARLREVPIRRVRRLAPPWQAAHRQSLVPGTASHLIRRGNCHLVQV